jgi:hypothetical protein
LTQTGLLAFLNQEEAQCVMPGGSEGAGHPIDGYTDSARMEKMRMARLRGEFDYSASGVAHGGHVWVG